MIKWIHHLLDPHCPDCKEERDEAKQCKSCESLLHQLEIANHQVRELTKALTETNRAAPASDKQQTEFKPITPPPNWRVVRQQLEAEDRKTAQLLRDKDKEIADLEKELGVDDGVSKQKDAGS